MDDYLIGICLPDTQFWELSTWAGGEDGLFVSAGKCSNIGSLHKTNSSWKARGRPEEAHNTLNERLFPLFGIFPFILVFVIFFVEVISGMYIIIYFCKFILLPYLSYPFLNVVFNSIFPFLLHTLSRSFFFNDWEICWLNKPVFNIMAFRLLSL